MNYRPPVQLFSFEELREIKNKNRKKKRLVKKEESKELRLEKVFQQITNDLYDKIETGESFQVRVIEKSLLLNLLTHFNRRETSELAGISERTLRNKLSEYRNLQ